MIFWGFEIWEISHKCGVLKKVGKNDGKSLNICMEFRDQELVKKFDYSLDAEHPLFQPDPGLEPRQCPSHRLCPPSGPRGNRRSGIYGAGIAHG